MKYPVFISMGGPSDAEYSREIQKLLGDQIAYHYQATGEEGVQFRAEIEAAIQSCTIFIVIWSEAYLKSDPAKIELAFFRKLSESSTTSNKDLIIIPRKQGIPDIQSKWKNPITQKDEFVLGEWRNTRALDAGVDAKRAATFVRKKLEAMNVIRDIVVPRGWLIDQLKNATVLQNYQAKELVFISGLHGDGRRTLLSQYMEQAYRHLTVRPITIDSVDGPDDLLVPLMDAASLGVSRRNEILATIQANPGSIIKEVRKILHEARTSRSYYAIVVDKFVGTDLTSIPHWMSQLFEVFKTGPAPLIFIITSNPVSESLLKHFPSATQQHVPGLEEDEMDQLVYQLSQEDPEPSRWTQEKRNLVARAAGSSPSLCKSIMHALRGEPNLDFVDRISARANENFGSALASLMAHWVRIYLDRKVDLAALRVIEKIGVTSKDALDEVMQPYCEKHGGFDLYGLRSQGLIEQLADGLYRIPPLIQRRLGDALWTKSHQTISDVDRLLEAFTQRITVAKTEYGAIYATNAINIALRAGHDELTPEYDAYLTTSMLFKAGLDHYRNGEPALANKILKRAMGRLKDNLGLVDITTKIEIARFAGLAAARSNDRLAIISACQYLERSFSSTKRRQSALAMSFFIKGFAARIGHLYIDAKEHYQTALHYLEQERFANRQRGAIYTELATTYLRLAPPDYMMALDFAKRAFEQNDVTHTLNAYIHTLIRFTFQSGSVTNNSTLTPYLKEIETLLQKLEARCVELSQDFSEFRRREFDDCYTEWQQKYIHGATGQTIHAHPLDSEFAPIERQFL